MLLTLLSLTALSSSALAAPALAISQVALTASPTGYSLDVTVENQGSSTTSGFYVDLVVDDRVSGLMASGYLPTSITPGVVDTSVDYTSANYTAMGLMGSGLTAGQAVYKMLNYGFTTAETVMGLMGSGYSAQGVSCGLKAQSPAWSGVDSSSTVMGLMGSGHTVPLAVGALTSCWPDTDISAAIIGTGIDSGESVMGLMGSGRTLRDAFAMAWPTMSTLDSASSFSYEDGAWVSGLAAGASTTLTLDFACGTACTSFPTAATLGAGRMWVSVDIDGYNADSWLGDNTRTIGFTGPWDVLPSATTLWESNGTLWSESATPPAALQSMWSGYGVSLPSTLYSEHLQLESLGL